MSLLPDAGKEKKTQEELENLQKELSGKDQKLEEAIKENEKLREEMTKLRKENETGRSYEVDKDTEAETRRKYIDLDLAEAGWNRLARTVLQKCQLQVCQTVQEKVMPIMFYTAIMENHWQSSKQNEAV